MARPRHSKCVHATTAARRRKCLKREAGSHSTTVHSPGGRGKSTKRKCRYGKLKNPIGKRVCKKK